MDAGAQTGSESRAGLSSEPSTRKQPGLITLGRHGRPDADRTVRIHGAGYQAWWANYDLVGLRPGEAPPPDVLQAAEDADLIFCSGIPRAMETARLAAPGREIVIEPLFVEAPLPLPPLPRFVQFKPPTWGVISRIIWWLGYADGGESRAHAEDRAEKGADLLVKTAGDGTNVMVFAHGWFNRMLRPALQRRGYLCVQDGGDAYWSFRTYRAGQAAFTPQSAPDRLLPDKGETSQ